MNIGKIKSIVKNRFTSLHNDENGMEAAQVILILAIVLLALIPIVRIIVSKVQGQGDKASSCLDGATTSTATC